MNHPNVSFIVARNNEDRRSGERLRPPYLTEEGMVLFDRRGQEERRAVARKSVAANDGMKSSNAQR